MVKVRFDGLDVTAMVSHVQRHMLGRRVVNIYDASGDVGSSSGSNSTYIFKLDQSGGHTIAAAAAAVNNSSSGQQQQQQEQDKRGTVDRELDGGGGYNDKEKDNDMDATTNTTPSTTTTSGSSTAGKAFLLMESGIRFHPVQQYSKDGNDSKGGTGMMPTPFTAKLRKLLRGLRLERVQQMGNDRVVLFQFGVGAFRHNVILELYAKGNVVVTDHAYTVLALLRSHVYNNNNNNNASTSGANNKNKSKTQAANQAQPQPSEQTVVQQQQQQQQQQQDNPGVGSGVAVQVGQVYPVTYATSLKMTPATTNDHDNDNSNGSNNDNSNEKSNERNADDNDNDKNNDNNNDTANKLGLRSDSETELEAWVQTELERQQQRSAGKASSGGSSKKKKQQQQQQEKQANKTSLSLKTLLLKPGSGVSHFGPALLEHCIWTANLSPHAALESFAQYTGEDWSRLQRTVLETAPAMQETLRSSTTASTETPGYVFYDTLPLQPTKDDKHDNQTPEAEGDEGNSNTKILQDFQPHLLEQHRRGKLRYVRHANFGLAVESFFAAQHDQRRRLKAAAAERNAAAKLEKIRRDHEARLQGLEREQVQLYEQATAVQVHADQVQAAITVVNSALDSGMDWDQLELLVQVERDDNHNPVAALIQKLDLEQDCIVLALPITTTSNGTDEDENGGQSSDHGSQDEDVGQNGNSGKTKTIQVTIDLKESAHANANTLFAKYRARKEKSLKTVQAASKAMEAAEAQARRALEQAQEQQRTILSSSNVAKRKPAWFEKFLYFITTENYLVLAGKDAQQNEMLVKRFLRPGDAYLHADVHGAASCILRAKRIRNSSSGSNSGSSSATLPLSEQALREAGHFCICRSSAWASKMVTSAWWVHSHQVSKTAPTGEYLSAGSFMVRGKKNYLPASTLEMGLAVLFRISDHDRDAFQRHADERRDFAVLQRLQAQEEERRDEEEESGYPGQEKADSKKASNATQEPEQLQQEPSKDVGRNNNNRVPRLKGNARANEETASSATLDKSELAQVSSAAASDDQSPGKETETEPAATTKEERQEASIEVEKVVDDMGKDDDNDKDESAEGSNENVFHHNERQNLDDDEDNENDVSNDKGNDNDSDNDVKNDNGMAEIRNRDNDDHGDGNSHEEKKVETCAPAEDADNLTPPKPQTKRGLSVRDRKLIKKYGSLEEAERVLKARQQNEETTKANTTETPNNKKAQQQNQGTPTATTPQNTNKRGKKAKMKRAMKKYADQDEQEKELAMLALQGTPSTNANGKNNNNNQSANKKNKKKGSRNNQNKTTVTEAQKQVAAETAAILVKDAGRVAERLDETVRANLAECVTVDATVRWDKFDADTFEQLLQLEPLEAQVAASRRLLSLKQNTRIDNFSGSLSGIIRTIRTYGYKNINDNDNNNKNNNNNNNDDPSGGNKAKRKTKAEKGAEANQWKRTMAEEGVHDDDLDDAKDDAAAVVDDTVELSKLTGKPHDEDLLLHAVPVCAPYQTLSQYTYRVKLTPGNMKRGKAAKQCVELMCKSNNNNNKQQASPGADRCKDLIKKINDNDWVQVICSDVKISSAGASKAIQKQKANNKKSKKKK